MPTLENTILLVEDSEDDVFTLKRASKKAGIGNPLRVATDGQKAVDDLSTTADPTRRELYPIPFLVLLDLKLPYRDGFQVLEWLRHQPHLAGTVVVVLTGSDEPRDQQGAYALGARSYLVKPAGADEIRNLISSLTPLWQKTGASPIAPIGDPPTTDSSGIPAPR